jgi:pimeloyl-ACP methyl ester carboxylesterase
MSTNLTNAGTLSVPGASLYYEVSGAGPVLLMIPGGPRDADAFVDQARLLSDRYTVVRYDPRGLSRSALDTPPDELPVETQADDAHHLLAAAGSEPAYVFGTSGGAQIGLSLAARYPEQVAALVAHEPPTAELLPEDVVHRTFPQQVYDLYRREGVGPAMGTFLAIMDMGAGGQPAGPPPDLSPEAQQAMARMQRNVDFWLARTFLGIGTFVPDIAALRSGSSRVVVAVGEETRSRLLLQCAGALADLLGSRPVTFPGDHGGFEGRPEAFAARLDHVLRGGPPDGARA